MPIFDHVCKKCKHEWEEFVIRDQRAICPECGSHKTEKLIGTPMILGQFRKQWNKSPSDPTPVFMTDKRKKRGK